MRRVRIAWITISVPSSRSTDTTSRTFPDPIGPEVEHLAVVLLTCGHRMFKGVHDVEVVDAVLAGRRVDLHVPSIVSRNRLYGYCCHKARTEPRDRITGRHGMEAAPIGISAVFDSELLGPN